MSADGKLVVAVLSGHAPSVGWAAEQGGNVNHIPRTVPVGHTVLPNPRQWRVATLAALAGHPGVLACLRAHGGNLEAGDVHRATPLMIAALCARSEAVRELIELGLQPDETDYDGVTALFYAAVGGSAEVVRLLVRAGAQLEPAGVRGGLTALMLACDRGKAGAVQQLLRLKATVESRTEAGWTALHYAADKGRVDAVQLLLHAGADPNSEDADGVTPVMLAASGQHTIVVSELLSSKGADPEGPHNAAM